MAWSARNWLGGKGKGIRQKLPHLSKRRDFDVTRWGNFGSTFKFKFGVVEGLIKDIFGSTRKRRKRSIFWR